MFACRNYSAEATHRDALPSGSAAVRSRSACSIGLIDRPGAHDRRQRRELERRAKWAYRAYRRKFNPTKGLVAPLRAAARLAVDETGTRARAIRIRREHAPRVAFVGLWDTVDAYGLPIDEMTRGWDQWVWPLSMRDTRRHATSRSSVMPSRWTTNGTRFIRCCSTSRRSRQTSHRRRTRHAGLVCGRALECRRRLSGRLAGARVLALDGRGGVQEGAAPASSTCATSGRRGPIRTGRSFDSRRGLGAYYRYNPRSIKKLTNDRFAEVIVPRPKIHESVFQRIAERPRRLRADRPAGAVTSWLATAEADRRGQRTPMSIPPRRSPAAPIRSACGTWCGGGASPTSRRSYSPSCSSRDR